MCNRGDHWKESQTSTKETLTEKQEKPEKKTTTKKPPEKQNLHQESSDIETNELTLFPKINPSY